MKDIFKNTEEYNIGKKRKMLIVFDEMTADMINNKKLNPVVIELFIRRRKLNISIVMLKSSLCDYGDVHILLKGNITVNNSSCRC